MAALRLFSYCRSSCSYRVRIALALKALPFELVTVSLAPAHRQDQDANYLALNPQGKVPILIDGEHVLTQSLAIIEYLDETCPEPPLLPGDATQRSRLRALAQMVCCDIQPLNNLRVLDDLRGRFLANDTQLRDWYCHWITEGLVAFEAALDGLERTGPCCIGNHPTLADVCLIPQVYNARRFDCDLAPYPLIRAIDTHCTALPEFRAAAPERQADAESAP